MSEIQKIVTDVTYAELVELITANEGAGDLEPGCYYRITDFATKHYMMDGGGDVILDSELNSVVNIGAIEPLTIIALNGNTLDKVATSELYPQDIIHYDWNGENWKYDIAFGAWDEAVLSQWKGVIYFRHDTLNDVSMGHDFRKVLNRRWKRDDAVYAAETTYAKAAKVQDATGLYMSLVADNTGNALSSEAHWTKIIDYAITAYVCANLSDAQDAEDFIDVPCFYSQEADPEGQYNREVKTVHLKPMKDDGSTFYWIATILQNNVFALKADNGGHQVMGISAEMLCVNNTFLGYQDGNILGAYFYNNSIGAYFSNNSIGANFYYNSIGAYFSYNSIGAYFSNNSIGASFYNNSIGAYFSYNSIGVNFYYNSIGANFFYNSIGANFYYNSIGANFYYNSIGAYFSYNSIGASFYNNSIGANFRQNTIADKFNNVAGIITGVDFTAASHVYAQYTCNLFTRVDGTPRLKYCNNSDVELIVAANA